MTVVDFKYKTSATSGVRWADIKPCWTKNVKSRDEIEKLTKLIWNISPLICAVMWESTAFFGEESWKAESMSQKEYLEGSGKFCPICGSDDLDFTCPTVAPNWAVLQEMHCSNCSASWSNELELSGYIDLKEGENANQ